MNKVRYQIYFIPVFLLITTMILISTTGSTNEDGQTIEMTFSGHAYDAAYPDNYQPGDGYISGDWWFPCLNVTSKKSSFSIIGYQTKTGYVVPQLPRDFPFYKFSSDSNNNSSENYWWPFWTNITFINQLKPNTSVEVLFNQTIKLIEMSIFESRTAAPFIVNDFFSTPFHLMITKQSSRSIFSGFKIFNTNDSYISNYSIQFKYDTHGFLSNLNGGYSIQQITTPVYEYRFSWYRITLSTSSISMSGWSLFFFVAIFAILAKLKKPLYNIQNY